MAARAWVSAGRVVTHTNFNCPGSSTVPSSSSVMVLLMRHFTLSLVGAPSDTLMRSPMLNLPSSSAESLVLGKDAKWQESTWGCRTPSDRASRVCD